MHSTKIGQRAWWSMTATRRRLWLAVIPAAIAHAAAFPAAAAVHCPSEIQFDQIIECSIDQPAQVRRHSFLASTGDRILIRSTGTPVDAGSNIEVLRSDGTTVRRSDGTRCKRVSVITCLLDMSGQHTILVGSPTGGSTGTYSLSLTRIGEGLGSAPNSGDTTEKIGDINEQSSERSQSNRSSGRIAIAWITNLGVVAAAVIPAVLGPFMVERVRKRSRKRAGGGKLGRTKRSTQ